MNGLNLYNRIKSSRNWFENSPTRLMSAAVASAKAAFYLYQSGYARLKTLKPGSLIPWLFNCKF